MNVIITARENDVHPIDCDDEVHSNDYSMGPKIFVDFDFTERADFEVAVLQVSIAKSSFKIIHNMYLLSSSCESRRNLH